MSMSLLLGWGLMRGIKIPHQDFALKMQGGLMRKGGIFGTLRYLHVPRFTEGGGGPPE